MQLFLIMGVKKARTAAEKRYHARVAALGCMICGKQPQLHHATGAGMGLKSSNYDVIPLCITHHLEGGYGMAIHAGTQEWESLYGTQDEMLEIVRQMLGL